MYVVNICNIFRVRDKLRYPSVIEAHKIFLRVS